MTWKLYALTSQDKAKHALSNLPILGEKNAHGESVITLHMPAMLPSLGTNDVLLEFELNNQSELLFEFALPPALDGGIYYFQIPVALISSIKPKILKYRDLLDLADKALDRGLIPGGGTIGSNLEQALSNVHFFRNEALLIAALVRRKIKEQLS